LEQSHGNSVHFLNENVVFLSKPTLVPEISLNFSPHERAATELRSGETKKTRKIVKTRKIKKNL